MAPLRQVNVLLSLIRVEGLVWGRGQARPEATASPAPRQGGGASLTMAEHVFVTGDS